MEANCNVNKIKGTSSKSVPGWSMTMWPLLGTQHNDYYNLCRDLGGSTNANDFWAGYYGGTISITLKGCGNAKINVGNCGSGGVVSVYVDEVKIGDVDQQSNSEFTFSYVEGSVLKIDSNNMHVRFSNFEVTDCRSPCPSKIFQSYVKPNHFDQYNFFFLVDCQWNEWNSWESCSVSCGGSIQARTRSKKFEKQFGGLECEGEPTESQTCGCYPCPSKISTKSKPIFFPAIHAILS